MSKTFGRRIQYACSYHLVKFLKSKDYKYFVNHRPWSLSKEALSWVKSWFIKNSYQFIDAYLFKRLKQYQGRIFLLPLQVSEDFQIHHHSDYSNMCSALQSVIESFAQHAAKEDVLLIKHHPMDRGFVNYRQQIEQWIQKYQLEDRVFYGYILPLPQIYPLLKGVVTINSTVGLSALLHQIPVKCLGRALYDIQGLTSSCTLAQFWRQRDMVDPQKFQAFRQAILEKTQINGSFYTNQRLTASRVAEKITAHHLSLKTHPNAQIM